MNQNELIQKNEPEKTATQQSQPKSTLTIAPRPSIIYTKDKPPVYYFVQQLITRISKESFYTIPKLVTIIHHLFPVTPEDIYEPEIIAGDDILYIESVFTPDTVRHVFSSLNRPWKDSLTINHILEALDRHSFLFVDSRFHTSVNSPLVPFLIVLVHVYLCLVHLPKISLAFKRILNKLRRFAVSPSTPSPAIGVEWTYLNNVKKIKTVQFLDAVLENKLRFYDYIFINNNNTHNNNNNESHSHGQYDQFYDSYSSPPFNYPILLFNEVFERGRLKHIISQQALDKALQGEVNRKKVKTRSIKFREYDRKAECLSTISRYTASTTTTTTATATIDCSTRIIKDYLTFLSTFDQIEDNLLTDQHVNNFFILLENYINGVITDQSIPYNIISIFSVWSLSGIDLNKKTNNNNINHNNNNNIHPSTITNFVDKISIITEFITIIRRLIEVESNKPTRDDTDIKNNSNNTNNNNTTKKKSVFSICITFIGSISVIPSLSNECFSIILKAMNRHPTRFLNYDGDGSLEGYERKDEHVDSIKKNLTGIVLTMLYQDDTDNFLQLADSLFNLWENKQRLVVKRDDSMMISDLTIDSGFQIFVLFAKLFKNKFGREDDDERSSGFSNNNNNKKGVAVDDGIEDDYRHWLTGLVMLCLDRFFNSSCEEVQMISLFASAGLYKALIEHESDDRGRGGYRRRRDAGEEHLLNKNEDLLSKIVSSALLIVSSQSHRSRSSDYHQPHSWMRISSRNVTYWKQAVSLIAMNIDNALSNVSDSTILDVSGDIYMNHIFNLRHHIDDYLKNPLTSKVNKLSNMKNEVLFQNVSVFTRTMSNIYVSTTTTDGQRSVFLKKIAIFVEELHESWYNFLVQTKLSSPLDDRFKKEIKYYLSSLFLSLVIFTNCILTYISGYEAFLILQIFSYIQFATVKIKGEYDMDLHNKTIEVSVRKFSLIDKDYINKLFNLAGIHDRDSISPALIPNNREDSTTTSSPSSSSSSESEVVALQLSRIEFLMQLLSILFDQNDKLINDDSLQNQILPLSFVLIENKTKDINMRAHALFQRLFSHPSMLSSSSSSHINEEVLPLYLKKSLENYPSVTPIESLSKSIIVMLENLSPNNLLVPYILKSVDERVNQLLLLNQSTNSNLLSDIKKSLLNIISSKLKPGGEKVENKNNNNNNNTTNNNNNSKKDNDANETNKSIMQNIEKHKQSLYFLLFYFQLIKIVHRNSLSYLLELIESTVTSKPKPMQKLLCSQINSVISKDYDYTKKEITTRWYLQLSSKLGLLDEKPDTSFTTSNPVMASKL
eukprot:TRINITY_DN6842_c2_g1_i1.p1 TRINITY_DN6842_c2_g1~~TRINITY_DN6842_c2_g1_i1.p1  ORF type:complete len:1293 (+),score=324.39 TRINITY_DN6842_c2_g1_i1:61-3939(+)